MGDPLTCSMHPGKPYNSTADAMSAQAGNTTMLLNGKPPAVYMAGSTNRVVVVPGSAQVAAKTFPTLPAASTFFLLDVGVGSLSAVKDGGAQSLYVSCGGTRVAFNSVAGHPVELDWVAPAAADAPVLLRVAAATSMGQITVNAWVLNSTAPPLPAEEDAYACSTAEKATRQCVRVPTGTPGAFDWDGCAANCLPLRCGRCQHVFFPSEDGKGLKFEDLPDDWTCPMCGAPKSAYARHVAEDGSVKWFHV